MLGASVGPPPRLFFDWGACPFEGCTYREWTTASPVRLFRSPDGAPLAIVVAKGENVRGLTGVVISRPVAVRAKGDIAGTAIKAGQTFHVIHYIGEGEFKAIWHGRSVDIDEVNISRGDELQLQARWWVKLRTRAGIVGWARSSGNFLHQDSLE